jgi:hypothetical protein
MKKRAEGNPVVQLGRITSEHARGCLTKGEQTAKAVAAREDAGSGFFQRRLANGRGSTPEERRNWRAGIYEQIREVRFLSRLDFRSRAASRTTGIC